MRIRPGEKVPIDVVVLAYHHDRREHATGESLPVKKATADPVIGATLKTSGIGADPHHPRRRRRPLAQIIRLVEDAQGSKVPMQRLADKVSSVFVPPVIAGAGVTFLLWALFGPDTENFTMAITTTIAD